MFAEHYDMPAFLDQCENTLAQVSSASPSQMFSFMPSAQQEFVTLTSTTTTTSPSKRIDVKRKQSTISKLANALKTKISSPSLPEQDVLFSTSPTQKKVIKFADLYIY